MQLSTSLFQELEHEIAESLVQIISLYNQRQLCNAAIEMQTLASLTGNANVIGMSLSESIINLISELYGVTTKAIGEYLFPDFGSDLSLTFAATEEFAPIEILAEIDLYEKLTRHSGDASI